MGEYVPLIFTVGLILVVGFFVPQMVNSFADGTVYQNDSFFSPLVSFVADGLVWTIDLPLVSDFEFHFNPFAIMGNTFQTFLVEQFSAFTYLPNWISIPMVLMVLLSLIYSVFKIMPTT